MLHGKFAKCCSIKNKKQNKKNNKKCNISISHNKMNSYKSISQNDTKLSVTLCIGNHFNKGFYVQQTLEWALPPPSSSWTHLWPASACSSSPSSPPLLVSSHTGQIPDEDEISRLGSENSKVWHNTLGDLNTLWRERNRTCFLSFGLSRRYRGSNTILWSSLSQVENAETYMWDRRQWH